MYRFIQFALSHVRTAMVALLLIFLSGTYILINIPRESFPEIDIPVVSVVVSYRGVSPKDSEKLLLKPLQNQLKSINGIDIMRGYAQEGMAQIVIEIDVDANKSEVVSDIKDNVDIAVGSLPPDADKPVVKEIALSDEFPIVLLSLAGDVPERILQEQAKKLQDVLESSPGVLEVEIQGEREEQVEIIIDPIRIQSYGFTLSQAVAFVSSTNQVVAAGVQDTGAGRFAIRAPGTFDTISDMMDVVVTMSGDATVTLGDIAEFRRSYKDPQSLAYINGEPAVVLKIKKKAGANQLDTIALGKQAVEKELSSWNPILLEQLSVDYSQDTTVFVNRMMDDLTNNVIAAVLLVMIVVLLSLGFRASFLVAVSIPGSFLLGMIFINGQGLTLNMMVLFGLILSVGLLVDGAVVVIEYADRKMQEGLDRKSAYENASKVMFWPVFSSTLTTLSAFLPLLFWPGIVGDFMRFLPLTLIAILSASLFMALIFVPAIGSMVGKPEKFDKEASQRFSPGSTVEEMKEAKGIVGAYMQLLLWIAAHAKIAILGILALIFLSFMLYGKGNNGTEFFPSSEPDIIKISINAEGNYALQEMDEIVKSVEKRIRAKDEYVTIYTEVSYDNRGSSRIGQITLELAYWQNRRKAELLMEEIRKDVRGFAGVEVIVEEEESGPPVGKTIQLDISSKSDKDLIDALEKAKAWLAEQEGVMDLEDSRPQGLVEMHVNVDRRQSARFGVGMGDIGIALQLLTDGVQVSKWHPDDTEEELEMRVRFPEEYRNLNELGNLRINTMQGSVPLSNFVELQFKNGDGVITHKDGKKTYTVSANLLDKTQAGAMIKKLDEYLQSKEADINLNNIQFNWGGEDAEQKETAAFLGRALIIAVFLIFIILLTQFNSFYATFLVLAAVVMSISGVFLGHMIMGLKFSIIMSGVGVIALAGIVVNNNIVLIDTYQRHIATSRSPLEAVLRTGGQRLRPVLLTTATTILGLIPMVTKLNIDFANGTLTYNSPTAQIWTQLSASIAFGLGFATILTLIFTPCMLLIGSNLGINLKKRQRAQKIFSKTKRSIGFRVIPE